MDSNSFLNGSFPTRGYSIIPSSFTLTVGSATVGLATPYPAGDTPYFVIRDNDPGVDGFLLASHPDVGAPDGVWIDEPAILDPTQLHAPPPLDPNKQTWPLFVLRYDDKLWMPFTVRDPNWALTAFAGHDLRTWRIVRDFTAAADAANDWTFTGEAFGGALRPAPAIDPNAPPQWQFSSWDPQRGDQVVGAAVSPTWVAQTETYLQFEIAGGAEGVALELLTDNKPWQAWSGTNSPKPEPTGISLAPLAGKTVQIRIRDASAAGWGHIAIANLRLVSLERVGR